jgi:hypothetical protein
VPIADMQMIDSTHVKHTAPIADGGAIKPPSDDRCALGDSGLA